MDVKIHPSRNLKMNTGFDVNYPRKQTFEDEGMISSMTRRNTVSDTSTDVESDSFSPSSDGK